VYDADSIRNISENFKDVISTLGNPTSNIINPNGQHLISLVDTKKLADNLVRTSCEFGDVIWYVFYCIILARLILDFNGNNARNFESTFS
jgi:hypothetical protein